MNNPNNINIVLDARRFRAMMLLVGELYQPTGEYAAAIDRMDELNPTTPIEIRDALDTLIAEGLLPVTPPVLDDIPRIKRWLTAYRNGVAVQPVDTPPVASASPAPSWWMARDPDVLNLPENKS